MNYDDLDTSKEIIDAIEYFTNDGITEPNSESYYLWLEPSDHEKFQVLRRAFEKCKKVSLVWNGIEIARP